MATRASLVCSATSWICWHTTTIRFRSATSSGKKSRSSLQLPDGSPRYISGFVSRFTQGETDERLFTHYRAQVVPWLWFLTRQADCRIFQNMAVPDIISKIFDPFNFKDFKPNLKSSYPELEYCVQYRETSFNFVSRLMEDLGSFTTSTTPLRASTLWCLRINQAICLQSRVLQSATIPKSEDWRTPR